MGAAEATLSAVAAMEATLSAGTQPDETRTDGGAGVALGVQSTRPVVECGCEPHERGFPEVLV